MEKMIDDRKSLDRRTFVKVCMTSLSVIAANPLTLAASTEGVRSHNRVLLRKPDGEPVTSSWLSEHRSAIFHYPYVTTPCFIIDLGRPVTAPEGSAWPGGAGPGSSIVSYSAICAHRHSYPTRSASFINFRPEQITYVNRDDAQVRGRELIYCCSERSVYDPAAGARVLGGPAPTALTSIMLEHDPETDRYHALGTLGKEQYDVFFEKFAFRIALDHDRENIREPARDAATVVPALEYSTNQVRC